MLKKLILLVMIAFYFTSCKKEEPLPAVEKWKVFNSDNSELKYNNLGYLVVDQNDKVWISYMSAQGISSFDGSSWSYYQLFDYISYGNTNLAVSSDNTLWASNSRDFSSISNGVVTIYDSTIAGWDVINSLTDIAIDNDGNPWLLNQNDSAMLIKFDKQNNSLVYHPNADQYLYAPGKLAIDADNNKWFFNMNTFEPQADLYKVDANGNWTKYDHTSNGSTLPSYQIDANKTLLIDEGGDICMLINSTFLAYDKNGTWHHYYTQFGTTRYGEMVVEKFSSGTAFWFLRSTSSYLYRDVTGLGGIELIDVGESGIKGNVFPYSMAFDSKGNKWISTDKGLVVYNENGVEL